MLIIKLKPTKELPVIHGHPWIFSGAVDDVQGPVGEEYLCRVIDATGHFVCQGLYNPISQIAVRVLTLSKEPIQRNFWQARIRRALSLRERIIPADTTCYRLINAEGDGCPGLVVDRYAQVLILQILCPGMDFYKDLLVGILVELFPQCVIHERSEIKARKAEGLPNSSGPLHGDLKNGDVEVQENSQRFMVDVLTGDRTGFYMEHRSTRARMAPLCRERDVLDLFSYSGAFSLYALTSGARSVVSVDSSAPAQALMKKTMDLNRIKPFVWRQVKNDASRFLADEKETYDLIVCDPPPLARMHEDLLKITTHSLERLKAGGILCITTTLSQKFTEPDLLKVLNRAALTLGRTARILEPLFQAPDYPCLSSHPQGRFLCGYLVHVE